MTLSDLSRALAPVHRRIMLAIGRAVLRAADDAGGLQRAQVSLLTGEDREAVDRLQPFGFTAVPLPGAEAVVLCVGGGRDHPVVIALDDPRLRPRGLAAGESCVYSARPGQRITLLADGTILVTGTKLRIECPVEVVGDVTATGDMTAATISLRNHVHSGVQPGSGTSGTPAP